MNDVLAELREQLKPKTITEYIVDTCHSMEACVTSIYLHMDNGWQMIGRKDKFINKNSRAYWKIIYHKEVRV